MQVKLLMNNYQWKNTVSNKHPDDKEQIYANITVGGL